VKPFSLPAFVIVNVVVNALFCPLLFFLLVLQMSSAGYISGFGAPGAAGEVIGSMIGVSIGTAAIALAAAFLVSICLDDFDGFWKWKLDIEERQSHVLDEVHIDQTCLSGGKRPLSTRE